MTPLVQPATPSTALAARPPLPAAPARPDPARSLVGPDGRPIDTSPGWVAPHAFNFASVMNTVSNAYSYRWDEALKDSPANALAMRRDAFYLSLLQERIAPTVGLNWEVKVKTPDDPRHAAVKAKLTGCVERVPDWTGLLNNLMDAVWYGRYGSQVVPGDVPGVGRTVVRHQPLNGDKIQYQFDGTPVVLVGQRTASRFRDERDTIIPLDRGGWGLRLARPEWRERFVIHRHLADDADYFQGEMAGGVWGVGLRSRVYWSGWMKTETLGWMLAFMEGVGMMDLIVLNYPAGNAEARKRAEDNAAKITNGLAMLVARMPDERYPAVEQVSINANGVDVLKGLISDYFDRHIERLFVGQSMSAGADDSSGLGGSGRAKFAQDTKFQLLKSDAKRLGETLTTDLIGWLKRDNCPGCEGVHAWLEFAVPDPGSGEKLDAGQKLTGMGVSLKEDELRELGGFTKPGPGDKTVGGQQPGGVPGAGGMPGMGVPGAAPQPGQPGVAARPPEPQPEAIDPAELHPDLLALEDDWEGYDAGQQQWVPHTIQAGPRKGQSAYLNPRTGELRDAPPEAGQPGAVGKATAAVGAAVSSAVDQVPGGAVIKSLGRGAVKLFHAVEKPLMAAMAATQRLAVQAGYERGLSQEQTDRLGKVLLIADFVGGYAGAAAGYAAAGALGGKAGSFMPTASLVYLAYSTARDPRATWRAAKRLVRARAAAVGHDAAGAASAVGRGLVRGGEAIATGVGKAVAAQAASFESADPFEVYQAGVPPELLDRLAAGFKGAADADWYAALVTAGVGATGDLAKALNLADAVLGGEQASEHGHGGAELAAAMLRLKAEGDEEGLAALAGLADDPDEVARVGGGGPEGYAKKPVVWEPYTNPKTGRHGRISPGGVVRYDSPAPAKTGRAATPKAGAAEKGQAQEFAVGLANKLAVGHPVTADELAALPGHLARLTRDQVRALNATVGAKGGKLKAEVIDRFVQYATANRRRPNGLVMLPPPPPAPAYDPALAARIAETFRPSKPVPRTPVQPPQPAGPSPFGGVVSDPDQGPLAAALKQSAAPPPAPAARPPLTKPTVGERVKAEVSGRWAKWLDQLLNPAKPPKG